jgi:threonine aldolase
MKTVESFLSELPMPVAFASDNNASVHPLLLDALTAINRGHCPSYGDDLVSRRLEDEIKSIFGPKASAFVVFNGTAANVISLQTLLRPFESVVATDCSHLNQDECGAPEKHTGSKLVLIPNVNGKLDAKALEAVIIRRGDQHFSQIRAVSVTQPTELGTVYTLHELQQISEVCKKHGLFFHMDGARFANAVVTLNTTFEAMTAGCGVDLVSFGGTKNGLLCGELIVCLKPELAESLKYFRKQSLNLASKSRFISAQFLRYLETPSAGPALWKTIATQVTSGAKLLHSLIADNSDFRVLYPVESNALFVLAPREQIKQMREKYFFYIWNEQDWTVRWMISWDTPEKDIRELARLANSKS